MPIQRDAWEGLAAIEKDVYAEFRRRAFIAHACSYHCFFR
jgi:hypothetical protein